LKNVKNKYITLGIVLLFCLCYFTPLIFVAPNSNTVDIQKESLPKPNALTQVLLHSYDFEGDTVGQDPSGVTLSVIEPAGSGTANVDNLGDAQQNHVAVHKAGGSQRVSFRDNISYYGNSFDAGVFHCKIYHDDSLFGILFHDDIGVLFRLDWYDGIIGRWSPRATYTTYNYNQWYDVVVYFNISLGWMFEIDGVRFGDGYAYPFEHSGSGGLELIHWCSAFSGGGNGFFRVDDVEFYYYEDDQDLVILFDEAHLPLYSIGSNPAAAVVGGYSEFAGMLTAAGYIVNTIDPGTVIDATVMSGADILVVVVSQNAYTVPELDAIETWVGAGGSILLIPDRLGLGLMMEPLMARFDFDFADDIIRDSDDGLGTGDDSQLFYDGPNILSHLITTGVSRVEMYAGDGLIAVPVDEVPIIITDTDGTATWGDYTPALGVSVMSVVDGGSVGAGKVCVIGDCNLWDSAWDVDGDGEIDFYDSDNEILALNTINWLTPGPSPSDYIAVTSPGSSSFWETETTHSITWVSTGSISDVKIELYENDLFNMEIVASTPNDGEYSWTIPSTLSDSTQYQIKISDVADPATNDLSFYFEIFTPVVDGQLFDGMYTNYTLIYRYGEEEPGLSHFKYSQISSLGFRGNWWFNLFATDYNTYYDVDSTTRIMTNIGGDNFIGEGHHDPGWIFTDTNLGDDIPIDLLFGEEHIFNVFDELIYDLPGYGPVEVWILEDLTIPGGIAWYEKSTGIMLKGNFTDSIGTGTDFDFIDTNVEFTYYEPPSLTITIPDSTTSWETGTTQSITWTSTGSISDVRIELYKGGVLERVIVASTPNDGSFDWTIPTDLVDGTDYQIRISDASNPATYDDSDSFEISTSVVIDSITVTNPSSTTIWEIGSTHSITWTSTGTITDVKIELYKGGVFEMDIVASTANDGSFEWTIPTDLTDGIDYQIRISDVLNPETYGDSPNFAITSVDIPGDGAIPGYNLYILIGVISIVSVILLKNRKKI